MPTLKLVPNVATYILVASAIVTSPPPMVFFTEPVPFESSGI